jgi:hypothetical protein
MANTVKDVKARVRSLVGDVQGDFCTDAYILPLINTAYETETTELMADTDSSFDEWVFDVPGVPGGTTNLANYQASQMAIPGGRTISGPLYGLVSPITMEWKLAGQPDGCYVEAGRTGKLPNVSPAQASPPYSIQWEWRAYTIYFTPVMYTIDLRIRGEFSPPVLVNDPDILVVHPRLHTATAFHTAALIGIERNNQNWIDKYTAAGDSVLEDISNYLTKAEQGTTTRIGRTYSSGRRNGWGGSFG